MLARGVFQRGVPAPLVLLRGSARLATNSGTFTRVNMPARTALVGKNDLFERRPPTQPGRRPVACTLGGTASRGTLAHLPPPRVSLTSQRPPSHPSPLGSAASRPGDPGLDPRRAREGVPDCRRLLTGAASPWVAPLFRVVPFGCPGLERWVPRTGPPRTALPLLRKGRACPCSRANGCPGLAAVDRPASAPAPRGRPGDSRTPQPMRN